MHIAIEVTATDPKTGAAKKTTECLMVFVAVDAGGDTVPVPAWEPLSEEDKHLQSIAAHAAKLSSHQEQRFSSTSAIKSDQESESQ
jgi:acyl-CoA hydrolase